MTSRFLRRGHAAGALGLLGAVLLCAGAAAAEKPRIAGARLGVGDQFKLGCWAPLQLLVEGGDEALAVSSIAITPDNDGVGVATTAPAGRPLSTEPGTIAEDTLYVRVGQRGSSVTTQILAAGRVVDRRTFSIGYAPSTDAVEAGEAFNPATATTERLYLQLGGGSFDLGATLLASLDPKTSYRTIGSAYVSDAAEMPRDAIGYDSFDAIILVAAGGRADWLAGVTPDDPRIAALTEWVESGGRMILCCGAGCQELLGDDGPLRGFAPGDFAGPGTLAAASAIEAYTEAPEDAGRIPMRGGSLSITRIENPTGMVEAFAGQTTTETPLVVRTPRGFGEVTFVAFDLDAPAIAGWPGRGALLRRLINPRFAQADPNEPWRGYGQTDFVTELIGVLDTAFAGVRSAPFLLIVGLVLLYLALIGPGDYFFVKKVLKRVEATWVTFPLIVIATSAAAYAGAYWLKGDRLRVNQVEIIDVDSASGATRGTLITHLFSPRAQRYDLQLAPRGLDGEPLRPTARETAWLGKPGGGLGGMQSGGSRQTARRADYRIDPTPLLSGTQAGPSVAGMPVQVWSTKSLVSRYRGEADRLVDSQLSSDRDGLAEGAITNDSGAKLIDCHLIFGDWAWRLGTLADGETRQLDATNPRPVRATTLLRGSEDQTGTWTYLLRGKVEAATYGSVRQEKPEPTSRYLNDLDLTHRIEAGDALLLCRVEGGPLSELTRDGESLVDPETDDPDEPSQKSWVFARFILPVRGN